MAGSALATQRFPQYAAAPGADRAQRTDVPQDLDDFAPYVLPDASDPAAHPGAIAARLLELEEHAHILENDLRLEFLMACDGVFKGGKTVIGTTHLPTVQGRLKSLFEMLLAQFFGAMPDFLITLDLPWWEQATPTEREALVYHELKHIQQETDKFGEPKFDRDGNPTFGLVEHDITAFHDEVRRYGAWTTDIEDFLAAARR